MKKRLIITLFVILVVICAEGKKSFKSRGSSSARRSKTNYNQHPAPTSLSYPQASVPKPSAPKPSVFNWQEKPKTSYGSQQPKPSSTGTGQSHSYPSSQTGLSGSSQPKQASPHQESIQRSSATQNNAHQSVPASQSNSHSYPASNGLSGNTGTAQHAGSGYPQAGSGLSGSGVAPPPYSAAGGYPNQAKTGYPHQAGGMSGGGAAPPPYPGHNSGPPYQGTNYGSNYHHPQGPPPPYGGYGGHSYNPGYGNPGYGSPMSGHSPQMPGYFGNYGNKGMGGLSRGGSALTGVGIAGAGVGTLLTGLALWNLARSTGHHHHTVIYDNKGQPVAVAPANTSEPVVDPMLADLVNCTLTISNTNTTEVLAIPCAIASSFSPDAEVKNVNDGTNPNDDTKCTVTVVTKTGKEYMTTIPCSLLLNTAAENNVTEPPPMMMNSTIENVDNINGTLVIPEGLPDPNKPLALTGDTLDLNNNGTDLNCTLQPGETRDPINPCYALTHNVTVIPLQTTEANEG